MELPEEVDEDLASLAMYFSEKGLKERALLSAKRPNNATKSPQVGLGVSSSPAMSIKSEKYESRAKAGEVIFRYKCKDSSHWEGKTGKGNKWEISPVEPTKEMLDKKTYTYMFQKTKEMAATLDGVVDDLGVEIFQQISSENRAGLHDTCSEQSLYLGRIRSDGKLTNGSVFFEGCLEDSDGHIVPVDMSQIEEYYVFPGQVVVIEGICEMGKILRASKIHLPKVPDLTPITSKSTHGQLNMIVATGPFTPNDSFQYEPFKDLLGVLTRDEPDICILMGPFIDASHKMIADGIVCDTFDELFEARVKELASCIKDLRTQICIVPTIKDAHSQFVYPTPPYSCPSDKITFLPDPACITVGDIVIGMTSTDVLMHLGKNELAHSMISTDRMGRLAKHLASQRSFYPMYPSDESVPLDVGHWAEFARMPVRPHILLLPSDLRYFIKEVEGTIVINPERLTKGASGGTYARIQVDLSSIENGTTSASVSDFCVGEIVKI